MVDQGIIDSFHTMWGNFPERARLIKKDRTVLAVNKAAEAEGLTAGVRCIDTPPKEAHAGCKANMALKDGRGIYETNVDGTRIRFWIPVEGEQELFVHFSVPVGKWCGDHPTI